MQVKLGWLVAPVIDFLHLSKTPVRNTCPKQNFELMQGFTSHHPNNSVKIPKEPFNNL